MTEINYFWDPLSDNILQERDEAAAVTAEYTAEPGLYGNVISQERSGVESQFHYDAQGSTLAVTDDNQNVTDTFAYSAFGETTERTGTTEAPFQYIGQKGYYTDELTGQALVRRRVYEPVRVRWISVDPLDHLIVMKSELDIALGSRLRLATYMYSTSSPLSFGDPSGLQTAVIGVATCVTPSGPTYIPRSAILATLQPLHWKEEGYYLPQVGSNFFARMQTYEIREDLSDPPLWSEQRNLFMDKNGCCCCSRIGFAQIVRSKTRHMPLFNSGRPIYWDWDTGWHIDVGVPYVHSDRANPCVLKTGGILTMHDAPGGYKWHHKGGWLMSLQQDFETCVVCLDGLEREGSDIGIYGCVRWGHSFARHLADEDFVEKRYLDTKVAHGHNHRTLEVSVNYRPSPTFMILLAAHVLHEPDGPVINY